MNDYIDRPRSHSQLGDYEKCPKLFQLKRVDQVFARPAAWLGFGSAIHSAAEAHGKQEITDRDDLLKKAQEVYVDEINADLVETPNADYWFSSGFRYPGPADILRRYGLLGVHLDKYLAETQTTSGGAAVWQTDEGPGIEWRFETDLDGVKVIGFADRIEVDADGELEIIDIKTGAKVPADPVQLKAQALAVEAVTGRPVTKARYLMTNPKVKSRSYDLTTIPAESLFARYRALDDGVKAGDWKAKPSQDNCGRCEVLTACEVGQEYLKNPAAAKVVVQDGWEKYG